MVVVELPEILDIRAASPLAAQLLAARGRPLTIDGSNVRRVGAQCIQVILSAKATWHADGAPIALSNPSDALAETLQTLGIPLARLADQEQSK